MTLVQGPLPCPTDPAGHTGSPSPLHSENGTQPPIELNWVGFCGQEDQRDHGVRSLTICCPDYPQGKSLLLREEQAGYREGHLVKSPQGDRKQGMQLPIQACPGKKRISFSIKQGQESNVIHQSLSKVLRGARIQHLYISNTYIHIYISACITYLNMWIWSALWIVYYDPNTTLMRAKIHLYASDTWNKFQA